MPDRPVMLGLPDLRARGWSPAMVRRLLGEPDRRVPNPRYRLAAPVRLYAVERVEAAEVTPEFQAARAAAARPRVATTRVMDGKRAELRAEIEARPVPVPKLGRDELLRCAIEDYNGQASARAGWNGREATADSDPAFLARIAVNYVRHSLTRYERDLDRLAGKIGRGEGERLIRRKAYAAIAEAYPHLAAECGRQLAEREAYDDAPPPDAEPRR